MDFKEDTDLSRSMNLKEDTRHEFEEKATEFQIRRLIPTCVDAIDLFEKDFTDIEKMYVFNKTTNKIERDVSEKTNEIRFMEWSCA